MTKKECDKLYRNKIRSATDELNAVCADILTSYEMPKAKKALRGVEDAILEWNYWLTRDCVLHEVEKKGIEIIRMEEQS